MEKAGLTRQKKRGLGASGKKTGNELRRQAVIAEDYARNKERALMLLDAGFHLGGRPATREELHAR